ncbi:hypothetical protein BASA50_000075 [Batrachochytrium salamandrivorans]|uniref:Scaffold protein Tuba n=1 Tax=Batrachochytrium salamandrivorans TaxID=1357716 RepID=A0ABQ8EV00_9FUNG|nr:hypothetical protein BASA50_000075 [Batrachochytrium salamandrivorans]
MADTPSPLHRTGANGQGSESRLQYDNNDGQDNNESDGGHENHTSFFTRKSVASLSKHFELEAAAVAATSAAVTISQTTRPTIAASSSLSHQPYSSTKPSQFKAPFSIHHGSVAASGFSKQKAPLVAGASYRHTLALQPAGRSPLPSTTASIASKPYMSSSASSVPTNTLATSTLSTTGALNSFASQPQLPYSLRLGVASTPHSPSLPRLHSTGTTRSHSAKPQFYSRPCADVSAPPECSVSGTESDEQHTQSVSRLSRMFEAQTDVLLSNALGSTSLSSQAPRRNLTAPSTRNGSSSNMLPNDQPVSTSLLHARSANHGPPPKPPKPSTLAAPSIIASRSRSHTAPASPSRDPFLDQSSPIVKNPSNNPLPNSNIYPTSLAPDASIPPLPRTPDRPLSMATIDIEDRLSNLAKLKSSFAFSSRAAHQQQSSLRPVESFTEGSLATHGHRVDVEEVHSVPPHGARSTEQLFPIDSQRLRPATPSRPKILQQRGGSIAAKLNSSGNDPNYTYDGCERPETPTSTPHTFIYHPNPDEYKHHEISRDVSHDSFSTFSSMHSGSLSHLPTEDAEAKRAHKWAKVIEEIVNTERSFLSDMNVLVQVYVLPSKNLGFLPAADQKLLFGNLAGVISTSTALLQQLEESASSDPQRIGKVFLNMAGLIETSYCDYCKHNEAAVAKLSEYAMPTCPEAIKSSLEKCRMQLQGKTGAWDLSSLIVKPVQRVLKYPLLIKALLKELPRGHPDADSLVDAFEAIELVAEKINEVKKRKDIVEKYIDGKGKINMMHGISKKLGRSAQQLKKKTGLTDGSTSDLVYDVLADKFSKQHELALQLQREIVLWLKTMKEYIEYEESMAVSLDELYYIDSIPASSVGTIDSIDYPGLIKRYRTACGRLLTGPYRDAETQVRLVMIPAMDELLDNFKAPLLIMRKRDAKMLDYDRANSLRVKGDVVDKLLADSADTYTSINAQLIEELPLFMNLVISYVHEILVEIIMLQTNMYQSIRQIVVPLADALQISMHETTEDILRRFREHMRAGGPVDLATRDVLLLHQWRSSIWGYDDVAHTAAMGLFDSPDRKPASASDYRSGYDPGYDSPPNGALVNFTGSAPAPRQLRRDVDTDAILRRNMLVTHTMLAPTLAPIPTSSAHQNKLTHSHEQDRSVNGYSGVNGGQMDDPYSIDPFEVVAMYPFTAEFADEVSMQSGMTMIVYRVGGRDETGDDWWYGEAVLDGVSTGTFGWFPKSFVN